MKSHLIDEFPINTFIQFLQLCLELGAVALRIKELGSVLDASPRETPT